MAGSLNKVTLIGNVGVDPEIRTTGQGKKIANISLATSEAWRDRVTGEKKEKTEWHKVVIFSEGLVSIVENYIKKGSKLYIEGSLQTRKWNDSTGQEKYTTEVVLQNFNSQLILLDSKNSTSYNNHDAGHNEHKHSEHKGSSSFDQSDLDDDIPF